MVLSAAMLLSVWSSPAVASEVVERTTQNSVVKAAADLGVPLDVQWLPESAKTGRLLVVDVRVAPSVAPIVLLQAELDGRLCTVWPVSADRRHWRLFGPVPIDLKPGAIKLAIEASLKDGEHGRFDKPIAVVEGDYDKRSITVGKKFTSPSKAQRRRAAKENVSLQAALATKTPERLWRGSFAKPTPGDETSPFGTLRTYNKKRRSRHLGWDLDGKVGAPITATNNGRIVLADNRFYTGGTVIIDHGQGIFSMYFHMSRLDVVVGNTVVKGEGLGAVGASGQVTGPHLHFSIKMAGEYTDPRFALGLNFADDVEDVPAPTPDQKEGPSVSPTAP